MTLEKKFGMLRKRIKSVLRNERLRVLRPILLQSQLHYQLDSNKRLQQSNFNRGVDTSAKDYILNSYWL